VSRTLAWNAKVFFHIKTLRHKYPKIAEKIDNGSFRGVAFWYETASTSKGEQVGELWLQIDEVPEPLRAEARVTVERRLLDIQDTPSADVDRIAQQILGPADYQKLSAERDRRLREYREAQAEKQRGEEEQRQRAVQEAYRKRLEEEQRQKAQQEANRKRLEQEQRERAEREQPLRAAASPPPWQASQALPKTPVYTQAPSVTPTRAGSEVGYFFRQFATSGPPASTPQAPRQIETKVKGVTYENRQSVVKQLTEGEQVWLRREPLNRYDRNAIRVERHNGAQIGYISKEEAATLAHRFDAYGKPVPAVVTAIVGGYYSDSAFGVRIRFTVPETQATQPPPARDFDDDWDY
jgi:hypothetical protein